MRTQEPARAYASRLHELNHCYETGLLSASAFNAACDRVWAEIADKGLVADVNAASMPPSAGLFPVRSRNPLPAGLRVAPALMRRWWGSSPLNRMEATVNDTRPLDTETIAHLAAWCQSAGRPEDGPRILDFLATLDDAHAAQVVDNGWRNALSLAERNGF